MVVRTVYNSVVCSEWLLLDDSTEMAYVFPITKIIYLYNFTWKNWRDPLLYQEQQGDKHISSSTFYLCYLCYWPLDTLCHMAKNQSVWGLLKEWIDKDVNKWQLWLLQSTTGLKSISLSNIVASFLSSSLSFFLSFLAPFLLPSFSLLFYFLIYHKFIWLL